MKNIRFQRNQIFKHKNRKIEKLRFAERKKFYNLKLKKLNSELKSEPDRPELQILLVLLRHDRQIDAGSRQIDALAVAQLPAVLQN